MKLTWLIACATLITACGSVEDITGNNPIIDTQGVNLANYEQDLGQCRDYADQVDIASKTTTGVVSGAVVGGVFGAVIGDSNTAQRAAGAGSVAGAARGVGNGLREREQVIKRCLIGRGYRVLN